MKCVKVLDNGKIYRMLDEDALDLIFHAPDKFEYVPKYEWKSQAENGPRRYATKRYIKTLKFQNKIE